MSAALPASLMTRMGAVIRGEIKAHEPLAPLTHMRVGGAAELYVRPNSMESLIAALRLVREEGLALTVLGGGANVLVGDLGVPGVTVRLPTDVFPEEVERLDDGGRVTLGGGAGIARVTTRMAREGWVGAEALAGIPGTLGGAVTMNAGTKNGECMTSVERVELATADGSGWVPRSSLRCEYRHTELPPACVVTRVCFRLRSGDPAASREAMNADLAYRKKTQPLTQPNFGSVFTNPPQDSAGRLIESVGLKGRVVGRAQISPQHANWIVNLGGASAWDVTELMALMQSRVREATGVELKPEVKRVGVFR